MLCWTGLCVAPQASGGQRLVPALDPTRTGDHHTTSSAETGDGVEIKDHHAPCLVDDTFAALREAVGVEGELTNLSLALFGICPASGNSSGSALRELAEKTSGRQKNGLEVLLPIKVLLTEEDESGTLELTFDLPQSPLLETDPVLLLALESPVTGENLDVTFTSQSLRPDTQPVCISGETQYIALMGKASEQNVQKKWRISAHTKSPDMKQTLKDILTGGKPGSNIGLTPLLIFAGERGTETRSSPSRSLPNISPTVVWVVLGNSFTLRLSQTYTCSGLFTDLLLPLRAEAVTERRPAPGPPRVPPGPAVVLAIPPSPDPRPVVQRDPAGGADQLHGPHHLLLHCQGLSVSGATWGAGPAPPTAGGAQAEVGGDHGAGEGGDEGGEFGPQSHREAGQAQTTL